jgi:hypothetical protein
MLQLYIKAERAVLSGQSFTLNGRSLSRANLSEIREGRREWERKVAGESARSGGGSSLYSVVDFRE